MSADIASSQPIPLVVRLADICDAIQPGAGHHGWVYDQIIDLERVAARHWRGTEEEWLGGWLLRAAEGFTGRANSALPVGDPGLPLDSALDAVVSWYRDRGLPAMIAVPMLLDADSPGRELDQSLSERSWATRPGPAFVMVADPTDDANPIRDDATRELPRDAMFHVDTEPDQAWLAMYHYRGQHRQPTVMRDVLTSAPVQSFASIRADDDVLAIARLSIADGWAGITAVEVQPARRRAGLGTTLTGAVCAEAAKHGVRRVFLQVETSNAAAISLYERCGFRYSHRYHYRVAPPRE
jgi:ribosomal protein S18 acetylase RimI-like enzyme